MFNILDICLNPALHCVYAIFHFEHLSWRLLDPLSGGVATCVTHFCTSVYPAERATTVLHSLSSKQ